MADHSLDSFQICVALKNTKTRNQSDQSQRTQTIQRTNQKLEANTRPAPSAEKSAQARETKAILNFSDNH